MTERDLIIKELGENLKEKRLFHTLGVETKALELADIYGEDRDKASMAALLHDYAKEFSDDRMLELARVYGIEVDDVYASSPNLLHGPVAAKLAEEKFGIRDEDILNAITYHTVGRPAMSLLEKIIYIADVTEDSRTFDGVEELRKLATENLDMAMLFSLARTIEFTVARRKRVHLNSVETYNYYIEEIGGKR